jgi:hypothetical protein
MTATQELNSDQRQEKLMNEERSDHKAENLHNPNIANTGVGI